MKITTMPDIPNNIEELIELVTEEIVDNTSGLIEEHTLRFVLSQLIKVLDAKISLVSPDLTADQLDIWKKLADFKASDSLGVITTTTLFPDAKFWGFAYPGTYPNADDISIAANHIGVITFNGTEFSKVELPLPQATNEIQRFEDSTFPITGYAQRTHNGGFWELSKDVIATVLDVPGESFKWKSVVENLQDNIIVDYHWDDSDQSILGTPVEDGLLAINNTFFPYSEAGAIFKAWLNISLPAGLKTLDLAFVRVGGSATNPTAASGIGVKADNTIVPFVIPNSNPATKILENISIDISEFEKVSLALINFNSNNEGLDSSIKITQLSKAKKTIKDEILVNVASLYYGLIDVKTEGAKGDGITNDTNVIQSCVNKCIQQGGGTLLFHQGTYLVSQIDIPNVTDWYSIGFEGVFNPAQRFGTIAIPGLYDPDVTKPNGTIIKGIDNNVDAIIYGKIGTSYGNFNTAFLRVKNLTVRTPTENPNIDGINAFNLFQLQCKNVVIDTGVYNVHCIEPTNIKSGLVTPHNSNCALTKLDNMSIQGFYNGILVGEHTNGDSLQIQSCKNGLTFDYADHASYFKRVCLQRNTNHVNIAGQHVFEISQLNMEYAGAGQTTPENAWQATQYEVKDPNNWGTGNITYANVKGNVGKVETCRIQGGNGIIIKRVGSDVKLTAPGIPNPS